MKPQATLPWEIALVAIVVSITASAQRAQPTAAPPDLPQLPAPEPSPTPPLAPPLIPPLPPVAPPVASTPAPTAVQPTAAPPTPAAPREPEFGDAGEYVISGLFAVSLGHLGYSSSNASSTSIMVQPSFDYFVSGNFSMGGSVFLQHSDVVTGIGVETNSTAYGAYLHPRWKHSLGLIGLSAIRCIARRVESALEL